MSTSLAAQLQRLAAPQTTVLFDSRKKPSILFEADKAATKDREVIYDIGRDGLEELMQINPIFAQFEDTLFDKSSIDLQRTVENKDLNQKLDNNIRKFFFHLSPYFMLQPAHKCLEWLIRRYSIHEFNREDFVNLILPYHETLIFVRCVQTLSISGKNDPLFWLNGVKKSGTPLAKKTILNHGAGSPKFLKSISTFLENAVKELDYKANILQAMINFFCTTTIGILDNKESIDENFVLAILRILVKGLNSKSLDLTAATYMIIGHLVTKTFLARKTLETFLTRLCVLLHPSLADNAAMLMVLIVQTQQSQLGDNLSESVVDSIIAAKWFPEALSRVKQNNGINVIVLIRAILGTCLKVCQQEDSAGEQQRDACKKFCQELLLELTLTETEAEILVQCILDSYFHKNESSLPAPAPVSSTSYASAQREDSSSSEVISLVDSDEEDFERKGEEITRWYSDFLRSMENQYPNAFDVVVKRIMKGQGNFSQDKRNALRNVLGFLMKNTYNKNDTNIFEDLFHYDVDRRVDAVRYLVKDFQNISLKSDGNCDLLKDSIKERLEDHGPEVVTEVLKLGLQNLMKLIGPEELVDKLYKITLKCLRYSNIWEAVTPSVIEMLTNKQLYEGADLNKIVIALYPFLFPLDNSEVEERLAKQVSNSEFSKKINILMLSEGNCKHIDYESILDSLEKTLSSTQHAHATQVCFSILLATSSIPKNAPLSLVSRVFDFANKYLCNKFKFVSSSNLSCLRANKLPLDIYVLVTGYLLERVTFDTSSTDLSNRSESYELQLKIFNMLLNQYFSIAPKYLEMKRLYGNELSKFLKMLYPKPEERVEFLTNFYGLPLIQQNRKMDSTNFSAETQVKTFKLLNCMLKKVAFELKPSILLNVLLGLTSEVSIIRECALESLELMAGEDCCQLEASHRSFLRKLIKRREELAMDGEQVSLILFTIFSCDNSGALQRILNQLLEQGVAEITPDYVAAGVLDLLKLVDDENIFSKMVGRGVRILRSNNRPAVFTACESQLLKLLLGRINPNTSANLVRNEQCQQFVAMALRNHLPLVSIERKHVSTAVLMIESVGEEMFGTFSDNYARELLKLVVEAVTTAQNQETSSAAGKMFKNIKLDSGLILELLDEMQNSNKEDTGKKKDKTVSNESLFSRNEWKRGVTLLELLQNKKQLINVQLLIPKLFEVLKTCLNFEEQSGVEYVKQMLLSLMLNCCTDASGNSSLSNSIFKVDLIVQCIRGTQNPQTHHHALLLLSHVAHLVPEQVLHNMMEIFTFMGSSIVRQEDVYSIQIISKIIETIIPTLAVDRKSNGKNNHERVIPILKIFADVILDVPEHRRVPLYSKLIQTLGSSEYLWMFLGVLLESDVVKGGKKADMEEDFKKASKKRHKIESEYSPNFSKRLEIAMNISREFEPNVVVETCTNLINYIKDLPVKIETKKDVMDLDTVDEEIFSLESHSNKHLRHYRYSTSMFVSTLIRSTHVINKIAVLDEQGADSMKVCYRDLIVGSLGYINVVSKIVEKARSENDEKEKSYWEISLAMCYEILEGTISLLAPDMMITVFAGLLKHRTLIIRLKVIDIFNKKLQNSQDYFDESHNPKLLDLLSPLLLTVQGILTEEEVIGSNSIRLKIAQESYLTLKHLSKILAQKHPVQFKQVLEGLIEQFVDYKGNTHVLASLILCIGELSVNVAPHSISYLPKYIPKLTKFITRQVELEDCFDLLTSSIVTSILKLITTLSRFLSPYLKSIIVGISKLQAKLPSENDPRLTNISTRLAQIMEKLATTIPLRLLIPAVEGSYKELVKTGELGAIGPLMKLLGNSFNELQSNEFNALQSELAEFFLSALQFRCDNASTATFLPKSIDIAEEHVIKAFVVLILKLSESTFRPLYYKVFEWANRDSSSNDRAITFFNLSSHVADALKHLFVLFASELIQNATKLLDATNASKTGSEDELFFTVPTKNVTLIRYILKTLHSILLHDNQNFINALRFDQLLQPIVDQLENVIIFEEPEIRQLVVDCLAQLTVVVADDTLWRQLNHQVLLKTRNNDAEVRLFALEACTEVARKIGENFAPLLPETIPFLAELQEDENQAVEEAVKRTIRLVEKVTGEELHKYL
ncbi:HEAT repeat-containing protein 1 homolog [Uranotaenia lowii]|uniref:HEAT repeat-containing protein 1 homolog n=1 Tax=Uranotaenia lowii TaxID=190385 RepID=UPI00247A43EF|nr:HEAT repeat-containing protein 1 homolog [Uranotaenia lowii]